MEAEDDTNQSSTDFSDADGETPQTMDDDDTYVDVSPKDEVEEPPLTDLETLCTESDRGTDDELENGADSEWVVMSEDEREGSPHKI